MAETDTNPEIAKLQEKNNKLFAELTDTKKRLEAFGDLEPDAIKAMLGDYRELKKKSAGGDKDKIEELLAEQETRLRNEFGKQLKTKDDELGSARGQLKERTVVDTVFTAANGQVYGKAADDFKAHVRRFCDTDDEGAVIVKDEKGKPRYSAKDPSKLMTPGEFIEELKTTRDHWFTNQTPAGGRQPGEKSISATGAMTAAQFRMLSSADQKKAAADLQKADPKALDKLISEVSGMAG